MEHEEKIDDKASLQHVCTICHVNLHDYFEWTDHLRSFHLERTNSNTCHCGRRFTLFKDLALHYHEVHHKTIVVCPCGEEFEGTDRETPEKNAEEHLQNCTIRGPKCYECDMVICKCPPVPRYYEEEEEPENMQEIIFWAEIRRLIENHHRHFN